MEVSSTRTAATQATQQPTQLQKTKQINQNQKGLEAEKMPAQEPPQRPVVNGQGQSTGRLLNVTA